MRRAVYAPLAYLYWLIVSGKTKPHALTIAISSRLPMTINILAVIWCPLWHLTPPNPQFSNTPMFSVSSYISSLHHQKDDTFYILHTIAPSFRKSSIHFSGPLLCHSPGDSRKSLRPNFCSYRIIPGKDFSVFISIYKSTILSIFCKALIFPSPHWFL